MKTKAVNIKIVSLLGKCLTDPKMECFKNITRKNSKNLQLNQRKTLILMIFKAKLRKYIIKGLIAEEKDDRVLIIYNNFDAIRSFLYKAFNLLNEHTEANSEDKIIKLYSFKKCWWGTL